MAKLNVQRSREILQLFDFQRLFVEELGWSRPADPKSRSWEVKGQTLSGHEIAHLGGVAVIELTVDDGAIPEAKGRLAVHREVAKVHFEHILIFVDRGRTQSILSWGRRVSPSGEFDSAAVDPRNSAVLQDALAGLKHELF